MIKPNTFPTQTEKLRMKTLSKFDSLYDNEQRSVLPLHDILIKQFKSPLDVVYIGHAIPAKISDFYGDFVQGDVDRMTFDFVGAEGERTLFDQITEDNDVPEKINDWATEQSSSGFVVLLVYKDDTGTYIQEVNQDQYFPQSDGSVIFATYFRDTRDMNPAVGEETAQLLIYTQHYRVENGGVKIERGIWTTDLDGKAETKLEDSVLEFFFGEAPEETIDGLDVLPIIQIDNGRKTKYGFGKSDYHDIVPQLAEVNEKRSHTSIALLKNLDAKLELPENDDLKNPDGSIKYFEYLMRPDKDTPEARYIYNENPLLDSVDKHVLAQLQMISYITDVPMWALLDNAMPERVDGMRMKLFGAIRKTNRKRAKMKRGIQKLYAIAYKLNGKELATEDLSIEFSDVLPNDDLQDATVEETKVRSGLSSKRSAIKRLENYDEDELDAEMEQIKKEDIESGGVDPNAAPVL